MNSETLIAILLAMPNSAHAATMPAELSPMVLFAFVVGATLFILGCKSIRTRR